MNDDLLDLVDQISFLATWWKTEPGIAPAFLSGSEVEAAVWAAWTLTPVLL